MPKHRRKCDPLLEIIDLGNRIQFRTPGATIPIRLQADGSKPLPDGLTDEDLLRWNDRTQQWEGLFASHLPGLFNWALSMSEEEADRILARYEAEHSRDTHD